MGDRSDGLDPARLDELAAVTKAYARYSGSWPGFANAAAGACLLVALASLSDGRAGAANLFVVLAPLVWLGVLPFARAHYQRRGQVLEQEPEPLIPQTAFVYVMAVVTIVGRVTFEHGSEGLRAVEIAVLVAVPTLAATLGRRVRSVSGVSPFLTLAMVPLDRWPWWKWGVACFALSAVGRGAYEHWRSHRLERRLAALKGSES